MLHGCVGVKARVGRALGENSGGLTEILILIFLKMQIIAENPRKILSKSPEFGQKWRKIKSQGDYLQFSKRFLMKM